MIVYNENKSIDRVRFTLMHEIRHIDSGIKPLTKGTKKIIKKKIIKSIHK